MAIGILLFLLILLDFSSLQCRLVALVQTIDDIGRDVETLGSIENVVALLGQNEVVLLVLVILQQ